MVMVGAYVRFTNTVVEQIQHTQRRQMDVIYAMQARATSDKQARAATACMPASARA